MEVYAPTAFEMPAASTRQLSTLVEPSCLRDHVSDVPCNGWLGPLLFSSRVHLKQSKGACVSRSFILYRKSQGASVAISRSWVKHKFWSIQIGVIHVVRLALGT